MSGGSYDYAYGKIEDLANDIRMMSATYGLSEDLITLRMKFADHLDLVAKAAHDIEWVDSGDYGPGDEIEAIKHALGCGKSS